LYPAVDATEGVVKRAHRMVDGVCECGMRPSYPGWADSCTRQRRPYQPSTSGDGVVVSTHLDPSIAAHLGAMAAARGLSRSALIREAVLRLIARSEAS
jgi:hypothetical protein